MRWQLLFAAMLFCCTALAEQSAPPLNILGVSIGQAADEVRRALHGKATFSKEEEGQQVWRVTRQPGMQYLIVGFDHGREVRYVTAVAAPDGLPMVCAPLGDATTAARSGTAGNVELRREEKSAGEDLIIIARGTSPDHLSSCSIKKQGAGMEEGEEEEQREKPKHP